MRIKGSKGFPTFWRGEINHDGWKFEIKSLNKKELEWIEKEMKNVDDEDELEFLKETYEDAKGDLKKILAKKRYGFVPFLKPSGKRGVFNLWTDPDLALIKEKQSTIKIKNKDPKLKKSDFEKMSIDDLNNF